VTFVAEHLAGRPDLVRQVFEWAGVERGRRIGKEWRVTCPFHRDEHPSLDIDVEKAAFLCRACQAGGDAVDFYARARGMPADDAIRELRERLGLNGSRPATSGVATAARRTPARRIDHEIRGTSGELVATHHRYEYEDRPKSFAWSLPDGSPNLRGLPTSKLPLYGSEKIAAWHRGAPIILTEGEKKADALTSRGYCVLATVTGSSGTPDATVLEPLRDRDVVLWPDNDDPGREHMKRIGRLLRGIAKSVRVLTWGEKPKDDAADFFTRGGTEEQLDQLISESQIVGEEAERVPQGWRTPAEVLDAIPQPKFRFFVPGIPSLEKAGRGGLPTGIVVVLAGWPDAGKTGLGTQIVIDIAKGNDVVAVLFTPDGGQEATAIRIGGLLGLDQDKLEARDPGEKRQLAELLKDRRVFIIDDSADGMVFERIRADAERVRPDLAHIYLLDSAQECLAAEKADELDERHRVIALMRSVYRTVEANPISSLAIVTSQVTGQAFAPSKQSDRTRPMGAPAESKKISFLSHLIVALEGDPSREPDFGRADVIKSKLRGPKPTFGLRADPATSRLTEIDAIAVEQQRTEQRERKRTEEAGKLGEEIAALLRKHGPLNVAAIQERVQVKRERILEALRGLEAQNVAAWTPGPRGAHVWSLTELGRRTQGAA